VSDAPPSPQALRIARFFLDNPNSIDTPRGIAAWTNIPLGEVRRILEDFARKGYLQAYRTPSTVGYALGDGKALAKASGARPGGGAGRPSKRRP
jgi:hypothetical protein